MKRYERMVFYDIRDKTRLRRVANILLDYAERLQYSVYYCKLSEADFQTMQNRLAAVISEEDQIDSLCFCQTCRAKMHYLGKAKPPVTEDFFVI